MPRSFVGRFRRQRRGLLLPPALPGGRGKFLRRASPSFWAVRGWLPRLWLGCGGPPGGCFPALPLNSPALRAGASRQQHWQQPSAALLQKEKHPGRPGKPLCRRCRATPGVASGSRGGPSGRPCRQARTAVPPHCLCRLFPCPVGFVQNPFVYRAKLNTAAFFEGDRRVHVFAAAHDSQGELARTKLRPTCAIMTRSGLTSAQFRKSHARKLPSLPTNPKGIGPFASGGANGNRGTAPRGEKVERRLASSSPLTWWRSTMGREPLPLRPDR